MTHQTSPFEPLPPVPLGRREDEDGMLEAKGPGEDMEGGRARETTCWEAARECAPAQKETGRKGPTDSL